MEEADELSDSIVFLNKGRDFCQGSALELKQKFNSGLTLIVHAKSPNHVPQIKTSLLSQFKSLHLKSCIENRLEFHISNQLMERVDELIALLVREEESANGSAEIGNETDNISELVEFWNLSESSLETLFYKMHKMSNQN